MWTLQQQKWKGEPAVLSTCASVTMGALRDALWGLQVVDLASLRCCREPKPRAQPKRITNTDPVHKHPAAAHKQHTAEKQHRTDMPRRMCLNPACKCPFESPQWRRGPLGPGTLCNACGTRYARIEAKKRGEKKVGVWNGTLHIVRHY